MADQRVSSSSSRKPRSAVDSAIGVFVIGSEIGKGSFAQVYSGKHKVSGAAVAIKSVDMSRLQKKLKENLYSEIKILKKLHHPHIVALHDCIEVQNHINLIMEYCELGDLSLFIKKREKLITNPATCDMARKYPSVPNGGLNEVLVRHFLKQLASALKFLRDRNLVHRDVKPQNLLLLPSIYFREANKDKRPILSASQDSLIPATGLVSLPMLKLADFGFARVLPQTSLAETLCGSPLYMAPEILRYEKYDAKADLWSVGTVLFEAIAGKPPFRANNHVELLRKIEQNEDKIKFTGDFPVSSEMKHMIRGLLKRQPVERMSFENFFSHPVVTGPIPGLVEDDVPKVEKQVPVQESSVSTRAEAPRPPRRYSSHRRYTSEQDLSRQDAGPSSPRDKSFKSSPLANETDLSYQDRGAHEASRSGQSPNDIAPGLGIRTPQPIPSTSAPTRPALYEDRRRRGMSNASLNRYSRDDQSSPPQQYVTEGANKGKDRREASATDEREKTAQDIAFEKEYVVVEKRHVEVNAFADELAAKGAHSLPAKSGHISRRATQQGIPTSTTGAIPANPSNALQIAQGRSRPGHSRRGSYDKNLSGSPGSTASVISKAIQDASLRLFGFKYPSHMLGKGASPPHMYSPFPTYPTTGAPAGLITDGRQGGPMDEDARVAQYIEDYATRSDVVWGFAEVKYKQLVPLAPSMDHGLGGAPADQMASEDEDGLTTEAKIVLSEEALVLYVKVLSLLAKSMDVASAWWVRKAKNDSSTASNVIARDSAMAQVLISRVNSIVQWVRRRFNETLEKAEIVRLRLLDAQKQLPDDHPSHPSNNEQAIAAASSASADGILLTVGLSAEKLMYDRALEMSRTAAINEIANEDLNGCEISYVTAIRMLEAVLDNDEDVTSKRRIPGSPKAGQDTFQDEASDLNNDDQKSVQKMIHMISGRLTSLRKKMQMIANASKTQDQLSLSNKRSGDLAPRSVPSSSS